MKIRRLNIEEQVRNSILKNGPEHVLRLMEEADERKRIDLDHFEARAPTTAGDACAVLFRDCGSYERLPMALNFISRDLVVGRAAQDGGGLPARE